jgi:signal transduction histidine kinase
VASSTEQRTALELTFPGDSEMARLSRAFDWATTSVGPVDGWPPSLTVTIRNLITARSPMLLFWGPELIQFYNDAFRPSLGDDGRHPRGLGAPAASFWIDAWGVIGAEIHGVFNTGVATWHEDVYVPIDRDGRLDDVWWTSGYSPVFTETGSINGVLVVCQETTQRMVTERDRAALAATLEADRVRLAAIFEHAPSVHAMMRGPDHTFVLANPAYLSVIGNRDIIGKTVAEALPEVREQGFIELLDRVRETGEPFEGRHLPVTLARVPGAPVETRYGNFVYQRVREANGDYAIVAHGVDVTEEVVLVRELRESEERLREQFQRLPIPTVLWEVTSDVDMVLIDLNAAAASLYDANGTARGARARSLFPDMETVIAASARALREQVTISMTVLRDFGGAIGKRQLELTIGPQPPSRVLIHAVDVTERIALEEQLRQAQKIQSIGRLAGGVAHDVRNNLTSLIGHLELALATLPPDAPALEDLLEVRRAADRAAEITRQLLAFSRQQMLAPRRMSLGTSVTQMERMLRRLLGDDIEMAITLDPDAGEIMADPSQMEQVVLNLAVNARDAMPGGGTLSFDVRRVAGDYVRLEASDTGSGMDEETKRQIFEPFFTTKEVGQGSGLGLSTVHGIVAQSGGHIHVESAPGSGARFQVFFPRHEVTHAEPAPAPAAPRAAPTGTETIMLVDDQAPVRAVTARGLRRKGYTVLEGTDGVDALRVLEQHGAPVDLLLTDAMMPRMGGAELVARVRERWPGTPVLFMSGYTPDMLELQGTSGRELALIEKPFTPDALAKRVREVMDGHGGGADAGADAGAGAGD